MLLAVASGFIIGIAIGSFVSLNIWVFIALLVLTGIVFVYKYFVEEKDKKIILVIAFLLLGIVGGMGRMYFSDLNQTSELDSFANKKIIGVGVIVAEPDVRETNTKLTVKLSEANGNLVNEKILFIK